MDTMKMENCCMGSNEMNPEKMMEMMQMFFKSKECGCDPQKMFEFMNGFCCEPNKANEKADKAGADDASKAGCG